MKRLTGLALAASAALVFAAFAGPAAAGADGPPPGTPFEDGGGHAVFVQTDNVAGNQVDAYYRAANGTLTLAKT